MTTNGSPNPKNGDLKNYTTEQDQPRLLVSVRNATEAVAALEGGCEILDIKEPSRGSLGMADVDEIRAVIQFVDSCDLDCPVSAAFGEVCDWADVESVPTLPVGLSYVKLGLAGLGEQSNWISHWLRVRKMVEQSAQNSFQWIAVAYADWRQADAPRPGKVIAAAKETGCAGVLFDTFEKTGRHLLEEIPVRELQQFTAEIRSQGLLTALAGSLRADVLPDLAEIPANILAIRTAGCLDGQRSGDINAHAVRQFKTALRNQVFSSATGFSNVNTA